MIGIVYIVITFKNNRPVSIAMFTCHAMVPWLESPVRHECLLGDMVAIHSLLLNKWPSWPFVKASAKADNAPVPQHKKHNY